MHVLYVRDACNTQTALLTAARRQMAVALGGRVAEELIFGEDEVRRGGDGSG